MTAILSWPQYVKLALSELSTQDQCVLLQVCDYKILHSQWNGPLDKRGVLFVKHAEKEIYWKKT